MLRNATKTPAPTEAISSEAERRYASSKSTVRQSIDRDMGWILCAASVLCSLCVFNPQGAHAQEVPREIAGARTISATDVIGLFEAEIGLVIIDSRTRVDFERGHIESAINISDNDLTTDALIFVGAAQKTKPLLFYCNGLTCGRAANAVRKALGWGYSNVYYYALGIDEWKANRLPLATHAKH